MRINSRPSEPGRSCLFNDSFYGRFFRTAAWTQIRNRMSSKTFPEPETTKTPCWESASVLALPPLGCRKERTLQQPLISIFGFWKLEKYSVINIAKQEKKSVRNRDKGRKREQKESDRVVSKLLGKAVGECAVAKASPVSQQNYLWCLIVWSLITFIEFFKAQPLMWKGTSKRK